MFVLYELKKSDRFQNQIVILSLHLLIILKYYFSFFTVIILLFLILILLHVNIL